MAVRWGFTVLKVLRKLEAVGDSKAHGIINVTPISCSLESPLSWIIRVTRGCADARHACPGARLWFQGSFWPDVPASIHIL